jgi:hypothetical protein
MLKMKSIIISTGMAVFLTALTLQPASSQESSSQKNRHETAVRELIRTSISPQYLEEVYVTTASQSSSLFQASIQSTLSRSLTDDEQKRPYMFWYRKFKELISYESMETMLVPVYMKNFTVNEVDEINAFYRTPVGVKLVKSMPTMARESRDAGSKLAQEIMADGKWVTSALREMRSEFPSWFPKKK